MVGVVNALCGMLAQRLLLRVACFAQVVSKPKIRSVHILCRHFNGMAADSGVPLNLPSASTSNPAKRRADHELSAESAAKRRQYGEKRMSRKEHRAWKKSQVKMTKEKSAAAGTIDAAAGTLSVKRVGADRIARRQLVLQRETEYFVDGRGLRRVRPYPTVLRSFCKHRWIGKELLSVFADEFGAQSPQYYADGLSLGSIAVHGLPVRQGHIFKAKDAMANKVMRLEPPVPDVPLKIVAFCAMGQQEEGGAWGVLGSSTAPRSRAGRAVVDLIGMHLHTVEPQADIKSAIVAASIAVSTGCVVGQLDSTSPHSLQGTPPAPRSTAEPLAESRQHNWDVVVLNKPPGVSVHFGGAFKYQSTIMLLARTLGVHVSSLHSVHRLDRPTSGCLLMARDSPGGRGVTQLIENGLVTKYYVAKVRGVFPSAPPAAGAAAAAAGELPPCPQAAQWLQAYASTAWVHPDTQDVPGDKPHLRGGAAQAEAPAFSGAFTALADVWREARAAVNCPIPAQAVAAAEEGEGVPHWLSLVAPIARTKDSFGNMCVQGEGGKYAESRFVHLGVCAPDGTPLPCDTQNPEAMSLVLCQPMTGRTHQLRVHLQALGYPIWNDPVYCVPATAMSGQLQQTQCAESTIYGAREGKKDYLLDAPPGVQALTAQYDWRKHNEYYVHVEGTAHGVDLATPSRHGLPLPVPVPLAEAVRQLMLQAQQRGSLEKVRGGGAGGSAPSQPDTPSSTHSSQQHDAQHDDGDEEDAHFLASDDTVALVRFWHRSVNQAHFNSTLRGVLLHADSVPLGLPLQDETTALILAEKQPQWWVHVSADDIAIGDSIDFSPAQLHCGGIWLHSWRYEGPSWHFHASLPAWGHIK